MFTPTLRCKGAQPGLIDTMRKWCIGPTGADATVECNIETRDGKGNSILRQEFGITILSHKGQKLHFSAVNR